MNRTQNRLFTVGVWAISALIAVFSSGCGNEKTEAAVEVESAPPATLDDGVWVFGEEAPAEVGLQLQIVDVYTGQMKLRASASRELSLRLPATTLFQAIDQNYDRDREVCIAKTTTLDLSTETQEFTLPCFLPTDRGLVGYHKKPGAYRYEFKDVDYRLAKVFRRNQTKTEHLQRFLQLAEREELNWIDVQTGTLMIKSDISLQSYHNAVMYAFRDHMPGKPRKTINYAGVMRVAQLLEEMGLNPSDYDLYRYLLEHVERNPELKES